MFVDEYFKFQKRALGDFIRTTPKALHPRNANPQNWEELNKILEPIFKYLTETLPGFGEQCGFVVSQNGELLAVPWCLDAFMMNFSRYPFSKKGMYKIAEHFGKQLHKAKADFAVKYLRTRDCLLIIEIPDSVKIFNKDGNRITSILATLEAEKGISFVFPEKKDNEPALSGDFYFWRWDRPDLDLEQTFAEVFRQDEPCMKSSVTAEMVLFAVKCIVYIFSAEPDLSEYKPKPTIGVPRRERDRNRMLNDQSHGQYPLQLVGYAWQKEWEWHVDRIHVSGHFRWQPCGPQKSQVKLIWIDEYTKRDLKKSSEETT